MPAQTTRRRRDTEAEVTGFSTGTFDARPDRLDLHDLPGRPPL
jgi:hypothetical protein